MKTNRKPFVVSLLCGIAGIAFVFLWASMPFILAPSGFGIIGGADISVINYYTYLIFATPLSAFLLLSGYVVLISAFCLIFNKTVVNNCNFKSARNILGISFCGAFLYTFLCFSNIVYKIHYVNSDEMMQAIYSHNLLYVYLIIAVIALAFLVVFVVKYIKSKVAEFKIKGFILEIALLLTAAIPFYYIADAICLALRNSPWVR